MKGKASPIQNPFVFISERSEAAEVVDVPGSLENNPLHCQENT